MRRFDRGALWRPIAAILLLLAFAAAVRFLPVADWARGFQAWLAEAGAVGALIFAGVYVVGALLLGPVWLLTIIAGLTYPLPVSIALVSAVSTLAAGLAFLIARHAARLRIERLARENERFAAIDRAIARRGWKIVFLLRLSPIVPYGLSNYLYGVSGIRFGPYLLASWLGMLPGTFLYVSLGAAGRVAIGAQGHARTPAQWTALGVGLAATAGVTIWIARAARRELGADAQRAEAAGGNRRPPA